MSLSLPAYRGSTLGVSAMFLGNMTMPASLHFQTPMPGHDTLDLPMYSFLLENEQANKKVLFDLGLMKGWKDHHPDLLERSEKVNATFEIIADVPELLTSASIPLSSIDSIIWSHHHVDHTGDPSLFPPTTSLIVGPGFKTNPSTFPGYPLNPDSHIPHAAFAGRDVIELDFNRTTGVLTLAGLRAIDWFDDGSLYLLEAPGHATEYIMALARTSADKFVLLAGDAASHPGVIRPSPLRPLITPSNSSPRTKPFFELTSYIMPDPVAGRKTLEALQAFDASEHVLVVLDHDTSLRESRNALSLARWEEPREGLHNRKDAEHWRFLGDFPQGVDV